MPTGLQKDDSIWLCETLETIGISSFFRLRCKSYGTSMEIMVTIKLLGTLSTYVFGSRIEGTTVYDSFPDMDILECNEFLPVREHLPEDSTGWELLTITDPDTSSGYVKLQIAWNGLPLTIKEWGCISSDIKSLLKEDHYGRLVLINASPELELGIKINGPAKTYKVHKEAALDRVKALRCRSWPPVAKEWIERKRHHDWPQQSIIKHFITLGCFVVGVGHHDSTEEDLEWRLSFSLQERELMFGLNDVQYKCYVLLKLIKADVITATVGESITSYHCKTCLFYMIERNPLDIWKPENLFSCVKQCLQLLLKWTTDSYCPNYFIPTENMFERRIKGRLRKKLIEIFKEILSEGFAVLNRIKTGKIDKYLQNRENKSLLQYLRRKSAGETKCFVLSCQFSQVDRVVLTLWTTLHKDIKRNIRPLPCDILDSIRVVEELMKRLSNSVPITEHTLKDTQEVVDVMLPFLHTILASHMASYAMVCTDQTQRMNYIRESEKHYKQGLSSDLTSGQLKYMTFLYFDGQYIECETLLKILEKKYYNFDIIVPQYSKINYIVPKIFYASDLTVRDILRTYVHASVIFMPTEYPLIHEALQFEIFKSFGTPPNSRHDVFYFFNDWAVVDSKVYMYFLWYILSTKTNKPALDRFYVIFKLILCTYGHLKNRETAFNLISWICLQEGFIQQAITFLIASWQEVKNRGRNDYPGLPEDDFSPHNAAKLHMLLIVKRLLDNGEIPSGGV